MRKVPKYYCIELGKEVGVNILEGGAPNPLARVKTSKAIEHLYGSRNLCCVAVIEIAAR